MKNRYLKPQKSDQTVFGYFPPKHDKHNFEQYLDSFPKSKYRRYPYDNRTEDSATTAKTKLKMFCFLLISIPVTISLFFL